MDISNSRKLVHIFNSSVISGPETLVFPALNELQPNTELIILTEDRLPHSREKIIAYIKKLNLKFAEIRVKSRFDILAIYNLRVVLKEKKIAITHSHDAKASLYTLFASLFLPIIRITTHHGVQGRPDKKTKIFERIYSYFSLHFFHALIAVSTEDYKTLITRGHNEKKTFCIWNGITKNLLTEGMQNTVKKKIYANWELEPSFTQDTFIIGVVGRLSKEKNCFRILRVAHELLKLNPDLSWKILFFGDGPDAKELKDESIRLQLEKRIFWMGYRASIMDEMAGFDTLLNLSVAEGQPISMLEAAWSATPVFAGKIGGIIDLIPNEKFGFLVSLNSDDKQIAFELKSWLENKELRKKAGCNFQNRVSSSFTREIWIKKHRELYQLFY